MKPEREMVGRLDLGRHSDVSAGHWLYETLKSTLRFVISQECGRMDGDVKGPSFSVPIRM